MSNNGSGATWLSLLDEKKHQAKSCFGQDYSVPGDISSDRSFRSAFEKFSKQKGDHRYSRLEAKLFPSLVPISELARAVSQSTPDLQQLAPNENLEGLVWWISYATIECGYRAGASLIPLVTLIAAYNKKVPRLSTSPGQFRLRFPNDQRVQEPLQDVYTLFIDSHLFIISFLRKKGSTTNLDPNKENELGTNIVKIARKLEEARGRYDVMVNQAAEDEERKKTDLEQPSLDAKRVLPDYLHTNSTSNREVQARFISHRFLGHGSYGEVDEVRELSTGASYARKHIHLDSHKPPEVITDEVTNEVAIMQKLRHRHIATVLFYLKEEGAYSIFMLPVAEYDLQKYLDLCTTKNYPADETTKIYPWFGCLLDALAYAHKVQIKHQDIKPSNILIKNYQPYLCDFGLAKDFTEMDASTSGGQKVPGTVIYRAPESEPNQRRGRPADVFSLGCVYTEMFTVIQGKSVQEYRDLRHDAGSIAFRGCLKEVKGWLRSFEIKSKMDELLMGQILNMIEKNTKERHTAEQLVNFLKRERAFFCVE